MNAVLLLALFSFEGSAFTPEKTTDALDQPEGKSKIFEARAGS